MIKKVIMELNRDEMEKLISIGLCMLGHPYVNITKLTDKNTELELSSFLSQEKTDFVKFINELPEEFHLKNEVKALKSAASIIARITSI